jgi:hypothetical protein
VEVLYFPKYISQDYFTCINQITLIALPLHKFVHPPCSLYWSDEPKNYDVGLSCNVKKVCNNFGTNKAGISKNIMGKLYKKIWRLYELTFSQRYQCKQNNNTEIYQTRNIIIK